MDRYIEQRIEDAGDASNEYSSAAWNLATQHFSEGALSSKQLPGLLLKVVVTFVLAGLGYALGKRFTGS